MINSDDHGDYDYYTQSYKDDADDADNDNEEV